VPQSGWESLGLYGWPIAPCRLGLTNTPTKSHDGQIPLGDPRLRGVAHKGAFTLLRYYREAPILEESQPIGKGSVSTIRHGCWATAVQDFPSWQRRFPNQNLTVYAGAGWLFHNKNYFARPDNTGRALFQYVAHADLDLFKNNWCYMAMSTCSRVEASATKSLRQNWIRS
jgi:hypothetical protein